MSKSILAREVAQREADFNYNRMAYNRMARGHPPRSAGVGSSAVPYIGCAARTALIPLSIGAPFSGARIRDPHPPRSW
jgi:hypothetical protein